ncbi:yopX family protein [Carnobacterium maltaromaticum LMA28]|uniref:YopX family protein n=1 Tax=Carnobacterium maltaromaticum LMA28 TaxID=1234679 RepID=K8ETW6_CARML|nr:YopX family protein [Carnobacterium maltaromaticum]CCO12076.2 yopX family protein [Carnobacterium maltaromaticum LMA28]
MREIKFRGKRISDGKWIEGVPVPNGLGKRMYILGLIMSDKISYSMNQLHGFCHEVIPETVGQYTGLKDMDREEIFEGAIGWDERGEVHGKIVFDEGGFLFEWENMQDDLFECCGDIVIVGNIYDNPELLGEAK